MNSNNNNNKSTIFYFLFLNTISLSSFPSPPLAPVTQWLLQDNGARGKGEAEVWRVELYKQKTRRWGGRCEGRRCYRSYEKREKKPEEEFTHTTGGGLSGPQDIHERLGIQWWERIERGVLDEFERSYTNLLKNIHLYLWPNGEIQKYNITKDSNQFKVILVNL